MSVSDSRGASLRDRLRRETAAAHGRVDALFGACDFATRAGYGFFLTAQAVAWETLRPMLDAGSIARADALREDLERLDLPVPAPLDLPLPPGLAIGHRYVLEGSRLGSTVLMRELAARSPEMADHAGNYLRESQKIDGWRQLSTGLQKDRDGCDSESRIIDDALFVFGLFEKAWRATDSAQRE